MRTAPSAWCASSATPCSRSCGSCPPASWKPARTPRELTEECGVCADEYISLGEIYPTVGYDTEVIYIWAARGLHPAAMHLDADEFLTPERVPLTKAYEMVLSGEIKDAKTVAGILKFKALLDDRKI